MVREGRVNRDRTARKQRVVILGGGPNRIGQGIEFDYCCCHAAFALREMGYEAIMVNCNPETVSTDYDTSDKLYFEPMTVEDVLNIVREEEPAGVIVQFGGQTPLNLAVPLEKAGVKLLGTSSDSIDRAENRERFKQLLTELGLRQPENATGRSYEEIRALAQTIGYPVLVRPSYVLGGRAMVIVYDDGELREFMQKAVEASPEHPVLIDKFLENAIEVDVDAIADGERCVIGAVMEHIEHAGIHSGDSACVIPAHTLPKIVTDDIRRQTVALAKALDVVGLINIQYAVQDTVVYVLEVNPRASRTVPFVSKAIGLSLANLATRVMLGESLERLGFTEEIIPKHVSVKEAVFPFARFPGVDTQLTPEMKSTGEVMGLADTFGMAFAKSQIAAGQNLPLSGTAFLSIDDGHKGALILDVARTLRDEGFTFMATVGTSKFLAEHGIQNTPVFKVGEDRPNVVDHMINGEIQLVINTPSGKRARKDEVAIRHTAWKHGIPIVTTVQGALAAAQAIRSLRQSELTVKTLQEYAAETHRTAR